MGDLIVRETGDEELLIGTIHGTCARLAYGSFYPFVSSENVTTTGTEDEISADIICSRITSGGAHEVALGNGTYVGQYKKVLLVDVTAGTITLTPTSFADGTSLTLAQVLDYAELRWNGSAWELIGGAGLAIVA